MKIFHSVASSRKRSNLITSLKIDGVETREPLILEKNIFNIIKIYWASRALLGSPFQMIFGRIIKNVYF
jgi:hypothetical protein